MSADDLLVTGCAGFIGLHLTQRLLAAGRRVIGIDSLNDYYDPALKLARLDLIKEHPNFAFRKLDLADRAGMKALFEQHRFPVVVHLAAQAGVPPAESLIQVVQGLLYGRCYSHRLADAVPGVSAAVVGADAEHVRRLSAANRSRERWDPGWQIYQLAANGQELVASGEVDIGLYNVSEIPRAKGVVLAGPVPAAVQVYINYDAAIPATNATPEAALALLKYMVQPAALPIWTKAGLEVAGE